MHQHTVRASTAPTTKVPEWFEQIADALAVAVIDRVRRRMGTPPPPSLGPAAIRSPYATVDEAAAFLRCKPQRVYDLCSSGVLPRHKDGARVLLRWSDLELHVSSVERVRSGAARASGFA